MKSIILYAQFTPSPDHQALTKFMELSSITLYVRTEVVEGYATQALERAQPRPGETVLNSIEVSDPDHYPGEDVRKRLELLSAGLQAVKAAHVDAWRQFQELREAIKPVVEALFALGDTDDWRGVSLALVRCHALLDCFPELTSNRKSFIQSPLYATAREDQVGPSQEAQIVKDFEAVEGPFGGPGLAEP